MKNKILIVLIYCGLSWSFFSQNAPEAKIDEDGILDRSYFSMGMGVGHYLVYNNEFSRKMHSVFADNAEFSFYIGLDRKRKHSLGFLVGGYDHYSESSKKTLLELLNEYGKDRFGDIVLNDWVEWHLGIGYSRIIELGDRWMLTSSASINSILGSRSHREYSTDSGEFIYPDYTRKVGIAGIFDATISLKIFRDFRSAVGISYDLIYGVYPVEYHVNFGTINGPDVNIGSYYYKNRFHIARQRLSLKLTFYLGDLI